MKDVSVFPARYNLIKLYRKAVHDSDGDENMNSSQIMLAMDYFDALEVDEFQADKEKFSKFMGLSIYGDLTEHDVAMQSIPLYCPEITEKMAEEYCCDNRCFKDPFAKESGEFRYFGMIQVYITPEILVRLDREHLKKTEKNSYGYISIYNEFFKDLHILMSDFVSKRFKEEEQSAFCYRVYQSMSVGDFVVAIRCNDPEVPFEVASMLRRRKYELKKPAEHRNSRGNSEDKDLCTNFVFYKTYTLMSLNTHIIPVSSDSESAPDEYDNSGDRKFVLRCVFSNKYWSNEKDIDKKHASENFQKVSDCLRLNGRYDFTVTLSEQAFLYIHPKLVKYKIGSPKEESSSESAAAAVSVGEKEICDDIEYLMKDKYISYVNERFLFKDSRPGIEAENYNDDIKLIEPEDGFLFANEINAERLAKLANDIKCTYQRVLIIDTSRRSIVYSMRLLERIVSTCKSINGISDSRIYCSLMIRQMEIVLEGVNYYLSLLGIPEVEFVDGEFRYDYEQIDNLPECSDEEYYDLIGALDTELKESLEYINSFAKFILDSSLQSLQTPHFNLETHVSVEKLLLSYSYFVQCFFDWYGQTQTCVDIDGRQPFYYTLMVPQPINTSLVTSTLFNWRIDETLKNRLLVVQCPSFSDLTHFSASVGILIHEIAHSLRYEKRSDRNKMILKYTSELLFDPVAENLVWDLRKKIAGLEDYEFYLEEIRKCLAEAYEIHICLALEDDKEKNFAALTADIQERYKDFVTVIEYLSKLRQYLQRVFSDYELRKSPQLKNVIESAKEFYQVYFGEKRHKPSEDDYSNAYNKLMLSLDDLALSDKIADEDDADINEAMNYLYDHLLNFDYYGSKEEADEDFWRLCTAAAKFERQINLTIRKTFMDQRKRVNSRKIAQYFNIGMYADLDGRERSFADYAESYIVLALSSSLKFQADMIDIYREVTSDLYMVKLLGLTPYGYLNFFTRNVPVDDIMAETYEKRFCMVLYALELEKSGSKDIDWGNVWLGLYREVCRHFLKFVKRYTDEKYKSIIIGDVQVEGDYQELSAFEYLLHMGITIESYMEDQTEQMVDNLNLIAVGAIAIKDSLKPGSDREMIIEQEGFISRLMHCRYLCSNLCSLIYEHRSVLQSVTGFRYLARDLLQGAKNLDKMHNEFKDSLLWKYCGRVSEVYNEDAPRQTTREESNRLMTEFVLDMNYSMLYSNAFEITALR